MQLALSEPLTGPYCADKIGLPRYCATIWIDVLNGHLAPSTRYAYAKAADAMYRQAESMVPPVDLDAALMAPDLPRVEAVLSANLLVRQAGQDLRGWRLACVFVFSVLQNVVGTDCREMSQRLRFMRQRFDQLRVRARKPSARIRAIPGLALEDIYEIFHPDSLRNPFRTPRGKWRNFVLLMLLVQLGLRIGEALSLTVDGVKQQFDPGIGDVRLWLDVTSTDDEVDVRSRRPRLKTSSAIRQMPLSQALAAAIDTYVSQYRGDVEHVFLFSSAEGRPLAASSVDDLLGVAKQHLSPEAKVALEYDGITKLSAHDFRHTSAVIRLQRFMDSGMDHDEALHRLRPFFGWTRESEMPLHYARAYFDPRHAKIWDEAFENSLAFLYAATGR